MIIWTSFFFFPFVCVYLCAYVPRLCVRAHVRTHMHELLHLEGSMSNSEFDLLVSLANLQIILCRSSACLLFVALFSSLLLESFSIIRCEREPTINWESWICILWLFSSLILESFSTTRCWVCSNNILGELNLPYCNHRYGLCNLDLRISNFSNYSKWGFLLNPSFPFLISSLQIRC